MRFRRRIKLSAAELIWYKRLTLLHPYIVQRAPRYLATAERIISEESGLSRCEMYGVHPDVLDVLWGQPLHDGFSTADARDLEWSVAIVRAWFPQPLLVDAGAERFASVVLDYLLSSGGVGPAFFSAISSGMSPTYGRAAAQVVSACPSDVSPIAFVPYWLVAGDKAGPMARSGISLEYAAAMAAA